MAMLTRLTGSGTAVATAAPSSPKAFQRLQNCIAFLWPTHQVQVQHKSTQLDAIECFTNELVERKAKKWEDLRDNLLKKKSPSLATETSAVTSSFAQNIDLMSRGVVNDIKTLHSPQLGLDIRSLSQPQLDNLLLSTLEIKNKIDFLYLVRQCIQWQRLPSCEVLIACLKYLSTLCRLQNIESLADICQTQRHPILKMYAGLAPFKGMALWRSGKADVALMTLQRGYGESSESEEGRRMIRNAFRTIAEETLAKKSEAVLVSLMEVARSIYAEHKDVFVIACVWKQCFASDWFCDQKSASDLFEHYTELQQLVGRRSSSLCSSFLSRHNIDAVHRLIEVFLEYNHREGCANCLSLLFNYQYLRKDLRACAEIVKSCSELEMPLSEMQNEQFLSLFLNQTSARNVGINNSSCNGSGSDSMNKQIRKPSIKEFEYKF